MPLLSDKNNNLNYGLPRIKYLDTRRMEKHCLVPMRSLVPINNFLNATAYLHIVADHGPQFMTMVQPSYGGHFQQDNKPCHKSKIVTHWFMEYSNAFSPIMFFTVTGSESHTAPFGCGGKENSNGGHEANHSRRIVGCHNNKIDPNYKR